MPTPTEHERVRTQTRDSMTFADLEAWGAGVTTDAEEVEMIPGRITPILITQTFPPCPGCGGPVRRCVSGAFVIDARAKTVTFRPCECVLTIPDMPDDLIAHGGLAIAEGEWTVCVSHLPTSPSS